MKGDRNIINIYSDDSSSLSMHQRSSTNSTVFSRNSTTPTSFGISSPNRNSLPLNQFSRQSPVGGSHPLPSAILSSNSSALSSLSSLSGFESDHQSAWDLSEFPSLGNRQFASNPLPSSRNYAYLSVTAGMVSKQSQEQTPEFQIQQEDFPALPGAKNTEQSGSADNRSNSPCGSPSPSSYEEALNGSEKSVSRSGIQTHANGKVTNIPVGMVTDQFGMVGLLAFIRAAETDPNLVALAPGIDLTTLGLNLNSPDHLYGTFQSPWADTPCRPQDIDFHVPSEYMTNMLIRDKLASIKLNRYSDDLLFYLFYMNGGDVLQSAAAAELYNRDWRYHKDEKVWIARMPGVDPVTKTGKYERGTYFIFDVQSWRRVHREFQLEYEKLEERPQASLAAH